MTKDAVDQAKNVIINYQRWADHFPDKPDSWEWILTWWYRDILSTISIIITIVSSYFLIKRNKKVKPDINEIQVRRLLFIFSFSGIAYMFALAPAIRFGIGYFSLIPGLLWALTYKYKNSLTEVFSKNMNKFLLVVWVIPMLYYQLNIHLILPSKILQSSQLTRKEAVGFSFYSPINDDRCWVAGIPCTPEALENRVKLLQPEMGIAGGFARVK